MLPKVREILADNGNYLGQDEEITGHTWTGRSLQEQPYIIASPDFASDFYVLSYRNSQPLGLLGMIIGLG